MPISYYLLLFFLCLSLHTCNARRLSAATDKKLGKTFNISNKNDEKGIEKIPVVPKTTTSLANELGETRRDSIKESRLADYKTEDQKLNKTKANQKIISKNEPAKTSGAVQSHESLVSVSMRVPRNKRGEKHPGFNSDYSRPKTHPPSHN